MSAPAGGICRLPIPNLTGQPVAAVPEAGVATPAQISDQFRLIGPNLFGRRALPVPLRDVRHALERRIRRRA